MRKKTQLMIATMLFSTTVAVSQMKVRDELPEKYKWNLSDLYATDEAWRQRKRKFSRRCKR
jgi:oligoendopeptidase F